MRIFQVLLAFGFVSSGHGAKERSRRKTQSPTMVSKTPLSELEKSIQSKNPVTLQQNELQSIIDTLNKALLKNKAEVPGKDENKPRYVPIQCQLINGTILCYNKEKNLYGKKFNMVQTYYDSFFKQYYPTMTSPMNQCSQVCGAFPSTFSGRYQFGCRVQCSCAQVCTDSYFAGRMCEPVQKNNPACCPAACPLNCPKEVTCSFSGLDKQYKCSCLGVTFVDPTVPDQNDLYFRTYHGGPNQPIIGGYQPINAYPARPETVGRYYMASDPSLDRSFQTTGNAYDQYYNAQNQYMANADRAYGGPSYTRLRYP